MRSTKLKDTGEFQSSLPIKIARLQNKDSLKQLKLCLKKAKNKLNEKLKRIKTEMDEITNDCSLANNQIRPFQPQHPSMNKFVNQNVHKQKILQFGIEDHKIYPRNVYPRIYDSKASSNRDVKSEFRGKIQHCRSHTQQLERDFKRKISRQRSSKKQKFDKKLKDQNIMECNSKKDAVEQRLEYSDKQIVQEQQMAIKYIEREQNPILSKSEALSEMLNPMKNRFIGKIKRNRYLHRTDSDVLKMNKQTKMGQSSKDIKMGCIVRNKTQQQKQDTENQIKIKTNQNQYLQIERSLWKIQRKVEQFQYADLSVDHVVVTDQQEKTTNQEELNKREQIQNKCYNNKLKDQYEGTNEQQRTRFDGLKIQNIVRKQKQQKLERTQVADEIQVSGPEQLHYLMVKNIQYTNSIAKAKY